LFSNGEQKSFARSHPGVSVVTVPCSGKLEAHHLLKTLASGAEGVLILACAEKACQYLEGSMRSHKRADYAREWLTRLNIEPERIEFIHFTPKAQDALDRTLKDFADKLQSFGTIPPIARAQSS
jgi:coenzyme F420-reducing hydrogenase delta subunit